ncbi:hypothetical protein BJ742DRAFT_825017, partial [Cladochytrium replicatum]
MLARRSSAQSLSLSLNAASQGVVVDDDILFQDFLASPPTSPYPTNHSSRPVDLHVLHASDHHPNPSDLNYPPVATRTLSRKPAFVSQPSLSQSATQPVSENTGEEPESFTTTLSKWWSRSTSSLRAAYLASDTTATATTTPTTPAAPSAARSAAPSTQPGISRKPRPATISIPYTYYPDKAHNSSASTEGTATTATVNAVAPPVTSWFTYFGSVPAYETAPHPIEPEHSSSFDWTEGTPPEARTSDEATLRGDEFTHHPHHRLSRSESVRSSTSVSSTESSASTVDWNAALRQHKLAVFASHHRRHDHNHSSKTLDGHNSHHTDDEDDDEDVLNDELVKLSVVEHVHEDHDQEDADYSGSLWDQFAAIGESVRKSIVVDSPMAPPPPPPPAPPAAQEHEDIGALLSEAAALAAADVSAVSAMFIETVQSWVGAGSSSSTHRATKVPPSMLRQKSVDVDIELADDDEDDDDGEDEFQLALSFLDEDTLSEMIVQKGWKYCTGKYSGFTGHWRVEFSFINSLSQGLRCTFIHRKPHKQSPSLDNVDELGVSLSPSSSSDTLVHEHSAQWHHRFPDTVTCRKCATSMCFRCGRMLVKGNSPLWKNPDAVLEVLERHYGSGGCVVEGVDRD